VDGTGGAFASPRHSVTIVTRSHVACFECGVAKSGRIDMSRTRPIPWVSLLLAACAAPEAGPGHPGWAPVGGISQVRIGERVFHFSDLLGDPREVIERGLPEPRPVDGSAWIAYGDDLQIRYEEGVATRIKARVPLGIDGCTDAARWMGFSRPRNPIVAGPRCTWGGVHLSNRLEKGFGGEYEADTRWFRAWLVYS
jgi:hypothetical protein